MGLLGTALFRGARSLCVVLLGCVRLLGVAPLGQMGLLVRKVPSIGHRVSPTETSVITDYPSVTLAQSVIRAASARD